MYKSTVTVVESQEHPFILKALNTARKHPLPPGWLVKDNGNGEFYYYNPSIGKSMWDPPSLRTCLADCLKEAGYVAAANRILAAVEPVPSTVPVSDTEEIQQKKNITTIYKQFRQQQASKAVDIASPQAAHGSPTKTPERWMSMNEQADEDSDCYHPTKVISPNSTHSKSTLVSGVSARQPGSSPRGSEPKVGSSEQYFSSSSEEEELPGEYSTTDSEEDVASSSSSEAMEHVSVTDSAPSLPPAEATTVKTNFLTISEAKQRRSSMSLATPGPPPGPSAAPRPAPAASTIFPTFSEGHASPNDEEEEPEIETAALEEIKNPETGTWFASSPPLCLSADCCRACRDRASCGSDS